MMKKNKKHHYGDLKSVLFDAGLTEIEEKGLEFLLLRSITA